MPRQLAVDMSVVPALSPQRPGTPGPPSPSLDLGILPAPEHQTLDNGRELYIVDLASGLSTDELVAKLCVRDWHARHIAGRPGVGFIGSSLTGVTTPIWAVVNQDRRDGIEHVQCTTEAGARYHHERMIASNREAYPLAAAHDWYTVKRVWDSEDAIVMSEHAEGITQKARRASIASTLSGYSPAQVESEARPERLKVLVQVNESMSAVATAADAVGAFWVSGFFLALPDHIIDWLASDESLIEHCRENVLAKEPLMIFQKAFEACSELPMILPVPARLLHQKQTIRRLFTSRILILAAYPDHTEPTFNKEWTCHLGRMLVAALAMEADAQVDARIKDTVSARTASAAGYEFSVEAEARAAAAAATKARQAVAEAFRTAQERQLGQLAQLRSLIVVCSGDADCVEAMSVTSLHSIPMLVLSGSGGVADLWASVWPEQRAVRQYDQPILQRWLSDGLGMAADEVLTTSARTILDLGDLAVHKLSNNRDALVRLARLTIMGDELPSVASHQAAAYSSLSSRLMLKRRVTSTLAALVGFIVVACALARGGGYYSKSPNFYLVCLAPAIFVAFEMLDLTVGARASAAAEAAARAAGLVSRLRYLYCTGTGPYAPNVIGREAELAGIDFMEAKRLAFERALATIKESLDGDNGADALVIAGIEARTMAKASRHAPKKRSAAAMQAVAANVTGDEYVAARLEPHLVKAQKNNRTLLAWLVFVYIFMGACAIACTVLAATNHGWWVAAMVAWSALLVRLLHARRIDELRIASVRTFAALQAVKLRWCSLSADEKLRQDALDDLVLNVEACLEANLPLAVRTRFLSFAKAQKQSV